MKIAFLVGDPSEEQPDYTTTRLAMAAAEIGHEVFYLGLDSISYEPDDSIRAVARRAPDQTDLSFDVFLERVREDDRLEKIRIAELDALMLRHEPELAVLERPWSQSVGITFAEMAAERGVVVLNDPLGFSRAISKLYVQDFPAEVRPKTLITRDPEAAKGFINELGGRAVVKPLQSGKGENVFLVRPDEDANVNQILEAVRRDGYIVVQEYLEAAAEGDVRVLLMNGDLIRVDDSVAAVHRTSPEDDLRANISTGGEARPAEITDGIERVVKAVRPKLVRDGMFFVGLDIAGDKLIEVNGTSPGTMTSTQWTTGVDFSPYVIEAIERKVDLAKSGGYGNRELATM